MLVSWRVFFLNPDANWVSMISMITFFCHFFFNWGWVRFNHQLVRRFSNQPPVDASQEKHREPTEVNITPEMLKEGGSGFPEPMVGPPRDLFVGHDAPWWAMKASIFAGVLFTCL